MASKIINHWPQYLAKKFIKVLKKYDKKMYFTEKLLIIGRIIVDCTYN